MNKENRILQQIKALGKSSDTTFIATVENNYSDKDVVDVRDLSGTLFTDVRKRAAIGSPDNGILITPALRSSVIVGRIGESDELFIEMFSEIDNIVLDGGKNGGLTITPNLVEELNKTNSLLQAIISVLTGAPIPEPGNGSPSALQNVLGAAIAGKQLGDYSGIENKKIKH